jgi:hypothetical protein
MMHAVARHRIHPHHHQEYTMHIHPLARTLLSAALALGAANSQAADFNFTGNLFNNTDRVEVLFDLASAGNVRLWTDSWSAGLNFDPISTLWVQAGNDFTFVQEVDDSDPPIAIGQGFYDTGHAIDGLAAGRYRLSVGPSFLEPFAKGNLYSQGFTQDGTMPTPIAQWNQPSYDANNNDQKGTFYSIHLSGVDSASVTAVPEPEAFAMLLAGLCLVGAVARRRRQ